jgi:hypothetical protein
MSIIEVNPNSWSRLPGSLTSKTTSSGPWVKYIEAYARVEPLLGISGQKLQHSRASAIGTFLIV